MKKILFASVFALMGTFAMGNEKNIELDDVKLELLKYSLPIASSTCNYSTTIIDCDNSNA